MSNSDNLNNKNSTSKNNTPKKSSKNKKKSKARKFWKVFFITILTLGIISITVGAGYVYYVIKSAPELDVETILNLNEPSVLFDRNENFTTTLQSEEERYKIKYADIPQNLIDAYVAIEDQRYWTHSGVDPRRLVGSTIGNIKYLLTGEGMTSGASTLTQQLLKNTILYSEASAEETYFDSINRKIKEIYLALKLNDMLTKEQIMEAYLNTIPLGGYIYGVEAASKYYFGKSSKDLTLIECAYIAGLTQMPTYYSAYNEEAEGYPNSYLNRTKTVLDKMKELKFISEDEYTKAYAEVDGNKFAFKTQDTSFRLAYEWFVYPALDQVRKDLKSTYKYTDDEVSKLFRTGGLKIYTTMDKKMQDSVQEVLNNRDNFAVSLKLNDAVMRENEFYTEEHTDANGNPITSLYDKFGTLLIDDINTEGEYTRNGIEFLQAAATVTDYRTGEVLAIVGGRGEQPANSLNRAYDTLKPIASTTKPLTVYGPAIDSKIITAATAMDDAPISSSITDKYQVGWKVNNWDYKFSGIITPREAIRDSKNITSVKTVDKVSLATAVEYGRKAGIVYNEVSETSMAAVALGQHDNRDGSDGANTTIMASAFGAFGNNGVRTEPVFYTKVLDKDGKVILDKEAETVKLFSPQAAYIMYDILKEPAKFDARQAHFSDMPVSGKTGTTDKVDYFWFSGLTPYYSASVWLGYDIPLTMNGYSSSAAALWGKVMGPLHDGLEVKEIEKPTGLKSAYICMDSGKLATDLCKEDPRHNRTRSEMFIAGTEPKSPCDVHIKVKINKSNNKLATENTPANLVEEKVFIKKDNASKDAADYIYVAPTEKDDTKPSEKIDLAKIGLKKDMDLYDAIVLLNNLQIKYTFNGLSVSGTLEPNRYILINFTPTINKGDIVELTIKENTNSGVGDNDESGDDTTPPTDSENGSDNNNNNPGNNNNNNNTNNN